MSMKEHTPEQTGFLFINGAGLDSRIWGKVTDRLNSPCKVVEFPYREGSADARKELSLADYAAHLKKQADEWEIPRFILVAHSLGGLFALRLAPELRGRLAGIAAVGAIIPKDGGSFLSAMPFPKRLLLSAVLRKVGTRPPDSAIRSGLCSGLTPEEAEEIVRGFVPEAVRVYTDPVESHVPDIPKLYVRLTGDKELHPPMQNKMIANFSPHVIRDLNTGHLPMISNPAGLSTILAEFVTIAEGTYRESLAGK
ncbi:alpha/beta fold hydrolase [Paenibacillus hamazuiensis]|uniref:alpha/beta fold hydrolase n=1 Tax=Paenibacillus hamazuiensis TaxID=2936508 RepID=UPI00200C8C7C|nr:alpha/beta hydrolase [Paenibacillus hamazuiensis]